MHTSPYELPLPTVEIDTDIISIETGHHDGSFTISNTGGGTLSGRILSRNPGLSFTPASWTGNSQTVIYTFSPDETGLPPGITNTTVYITSNGGEIPLPIRINSSPMTILTTEGPSISSIQDFYNYALSYPAAARRLFTSSEFYMLLLSTGYEYMDIYEHLHKDVNRERAMDNFFVLSGLKGKTKLTLSTQRIDFASGPTGKLQRAFQVQKSDTGYADAPVTALGGAGWLEVSTGRLSFADFDANNRATVRITLDPKLIPGAFAREQIMVGPAPDPGNILEITFRRLAPFNVRLNRQGFRYEDKGSIEVENNTGSNIRIDLHSRDRYVRFYAQSHMAGAVHSIPFEIRPSAFASAQRIFRRLPYVATYIDVRVHSHGRVFHERLHLKIGEW